MEHPVHSIFSSIHRLSIRDTSDIFGPPGSWLPLSTNITLSFLVCMIHKESIHKNDLVMIVGITAPPLAGGKAEAILGTRLNCRHQFSRAFHRYIGDSRPTWIIKINPQ